MDDLLREAIADAKSVRETALANAKIALEEAFTPRLQSMLSKKIQSEMEDSDEEMEDAEEMRDSEEGMHDEEEGMHDAEEEMDTDEMEDSEEGMHDEEEGMHDAEEEMEEVEDKDEEDAEEMREDEDAEEEDSVEETEDAEEEDSEEMREEETEEEDELDLESVLAELEKDLDDEDQVDEMEDKEEEEKVDENDVSSEIGKADNKVADKANDSSSVGQGPESEGSDKKAGDELSDHDTVKESEDKEEDLDLDEVLRALTEEDKEEEDAEENEKLKAEIKEHREVIHFMRSKLNEVNLLNAKLLFSNKLFRAFGLNNNQKLKVVENFDRTKNLREVKLVYATLAESFKRPTKLSESVSKGSSSKPTRSTKPAKAEVLSEGAELKARFKKLANILQETKK